MNTQTAPQHQTTTDEAIRQFETQAINFGYRFINDSGIRRAYMEKTRMYAQSLREALAAKEITPSGIKARRVRPWSDSGQNSKGGLKYIVAGLRVNACSFALF